jgi:hypothetical protein
MRGGYEVERGRPKLAMTKLRLQVLSEYAELAAKGERIRLAELARRCRLYSYRDARRVLNDLRSMGVV